MGRRLRPCTRTVCTALSLVSALSIAGTVVCGEVLVELQPGEVSVSADAEGYARFEGEDVRCISEAGQPAIPYSGITVLLPPGANPSSVTAGIGGATFEEVPGTWNVRPAPPPATWDGTRVITVWPQDRTIVNGRDISVYGSNALFPSRVLGELSSGSMRGWKLASVPVALFRYNPVTGRLLRLRGGELRVEYAETEDAGTRRNSASDAIAAPRVADLAVNYDEAAHLYAQRRESGPGPGGNTYVILTTSSIQSSLTNLERFIVNKEARGFTVQVVTEGDWGGGTGNTAAENIRSWLAANYVSSNIEYVLLIGNPHPASGDVPMKYCCPHESNVPTDYYYTELTGNWDKDGDNRYGEFGDDFGAGGIDLFWDVIVGRIPYYGYIDDVDAILDKTIEYENTPEADAAWRHNVLLPMVPMSGGTPMYQLGEELKEYDIEPKGWSCHRIYASGYGITPPPETIGNSVTNTTNAWSASPFGAVFWATHGSSTSASGVMDLDHAATLDDGYPSFTYQGSCTNSHPETTNNLAYSILLNGGIATVGATRSSWFTSPQTSFTGGAPTIGTIGYHYGSRMITDGQACGYALQNLKEYLRYWLNSYWWQNYVVFNVYGDPSLGLTTTLVDDDYDGMPDWWEITYFGDISQPDSGDYDSDNLTNLEEYGEGTNPTDDDCDGDGLLDGDEVKTHSTDPLDADTDGDGLDDGDEITEGADPNDTDSDDDCLLDGEEVNTYGTSPTDANGDGDDWCDVLEVAGGTDPDDPDDPPHGAAPPLIRISFQPDGTIRPDGCAPSSGAPYSAVLGYGWL